jgi:hypothetical protein
VVNAEDHVGDPRLSGKWYEVYLHWFMAAGDWEWRLPAWNIDSLFPRPSSPGVGVAAIRGGSILAGAYTFQHSQPANEDEAPASLQRMNLAHLAVEWSRWDWHIDWPPITVSIGLTTVQNSHS